MGDSSLALHAGSADPPAVERRGEASEVRSAARAAMAPLACDVCQRPAQVHILIDYQRGEQVVRRYCASCAETREAAHREHVTERRHLGPAALISIVGVFLAIIAVTLDLLPTGNPGFGWYQKLGVVVGGVMLLLGALLHVDVMVIGSVIGVVFILSADQATADDASAWRMQLLLAGAAACLAALPVVKVYYLMRNWGVTPGSPPTTNSASQRAVQ